MQYVVDGTNVALLGTSRKPDVRSADLRKVLGVVRELLYNDYSFRCYFDSTMVHYVLEEQRDLLSLIGTLHQDDFKFAHKRTEADDYALQRANHEGAVIVSADDYGKYRDRYPWLSDPKRQVKPLFEGDSINLPGIGIVELGSSALDTYHDLRPFLS